MFNEDDSDCFSMLIVILMIIILLCVPGHCQQATQRVGPTMYSPYTFNSHDAHASEQSFMGGGTYSVATGTQTDFPAPNEISLGDVARYYRGLQQAASTFYKLSEVSSIADNVYTGYSALLKKNVMILTENCTERAHGEDAGLWVAPEIYSSRIQFESGKVCRVTDVF